MIIIKNIDNPKDVKYDVITVGSATIDFFVDTGKQLFKEI